MNKERKKCICIYTWWLLLFCVGMRTEMKGHLKETFPPSTKCVVICRKNKTSFQNKVVHGNHPPVATGELSVLSRLGEDIFMNIIC